MARMKGDVPVDLSLADSIETRKLAGPLSITIDGDRITLAPLAELVDEFSLVTGEARGHVAMRGTWDRVSAGEPAVQVDIGAAARAERVGLARRRAAADRALAARAKRHRLGLAILAHTGTIQRS